MCVQYTAILTATGDNGGTKDKAHNITYDVTICMPGQTNFTGYINHFRMPSPESKGTGNFWYSFDNGMVHYVVFDTETDLGDGHQGPDEPNGPEAENAGPFGKMMNSQLDWMESDLKAVNRSKTPWVVASTHIIFFTVLESLMLILSTKWATDPSTAAPPKTPATSAISAANPSNLYFSSMTLT